VFKQSPEKLKRIKRERKIIAAVLLATILLLGVVDHWRKANSDRQLEIREYFQQAVEEHQQENKGLGLEYLGGMRGPDGLYHQIND
jgi:hypothetical protein